VIGKIFGLFAFVGSTALGLALTGALAWTIYTAGYVAGSEGCDSAGLAR